MVTVRGRWNESDESTAIVCFPDSGVKNELSEYDDVHESLQTVGRILTIGLNVDAEKNPGKFVPQIIEVLDELGLAKPLLYGRDAGAMIALAVKLKHPKRVGRIVLENKRDNQNEKQYKKMIKKNPGAAMGVWGGPWSLLMVMDKSKGTCEMPGMKKGKLNKSNTTLLWPIHNKGKSCSPKTGTGVWLKMIEESVGDVRIVDSHGWKPAD